MDNKTYITTAIPYVNGRPHIGFALELVQADVIARYHRLIGKKVVLQTGTDENASKNVFTARKLGIKTEELVQQNASMFLDLAQSLNISYDNFIRTTDPAHTLAVRKFWQALKSDDVYTKEYTGLYCSGCEDFYMEKDLVDGFCPDHKKLPVKVQERNYFFRLSRYQARLEQLINDDVVKVFPVSRKNEVLSFICSGLQDFSISRAAERSDGWGISVPDDSSQIIYVWVDALINYLTGLGYGSSYRWRDWWDKETGKIHVIGKNVWKFHAVYWLGLLLSAGLELPDEIVVHGFLTENGEKISKSLGSSIDPLELVGHYGADPVRYYLLGEVSAFSDGDFSMDRLNKAYETKLANGLGNLVSRFTALCQRAGFSASVSAGKCEAPDGYHKALSKYEFDNALKILWREIAEVNQDIDRSKPWELIKNRDDVAVSELLNKWLAGLKNIAYWIRPFIPVTGEKIQRLLNEKTIVASGALFPKE